MRPSTEYVGRFAPSPSGELHLGSLLTAIASFLDARSHRGRWLLRIEDLDQARNIAGAADGILRILESLELWWDGAVVYQSDRIAVYEAALDQLRASNLTFRCSCSRRELADGEPYPGTCRNAPRVPRQAMSTRLEVTSMNVQVADLIQGEFAQDVAKSHGDFILRRRYQVVAYVLVVVVDDAAQGVTRVIRGADLLEHTPLQIYLQRALGVHTPGYAHVPVLTEADGSKLAKSRRSVGLSPARPVLKVLELLEILGLRPPPALADGALQECWNWAISNWRIDGVPKRRCIALS